MTYLIDKFLNNTITILELEELQEWLKNPKHQTEFKLYISELSDINNALQDIDTKLAYTSILKRIYTKETPVRQFYARWGKYVAIVTVFLAIGYMYQQEYFSNTPELVIPNENIVLKLENGNILILKEDGESKVIDTEGEIIGNQKGNQLIYNKEVVEKEALRYNTITVPYGKRFKIKLSDNTIVNLNSGTTLKYPVKFIEGEDRKVFLKGEAFFSVTKDTKHPFIVNTDNINIRVLGTKFNVSSYPEDENINTVLVEGAVNVYKNDVAYNKKTVTKLDPGFKATWEKNKKHFTVKKADVEMYTAWINGKIIFRYTTFENIIKKLERHYNVVIINNNSSLNNERFAATFDVETIEEVLECFKKNYQINYTIKNNLIKIN
ncbi:FecR family protein [Thalassobellus suaedae]|uniref:FecR family protein n=1 Tax=Thalassobellus suaedae TaxID=3074124 RepID=A0ABY9XST6_9FLAO|nr:FecR family protein [Flavobacteriaceae bacterium HL-DH14]